MAIHSSILAWRIYGQRSLVGYGPQCHKKLNTTEVTAHTHTHTHSVHTHTVYTHAQCMYVNPNLSIHPTCPYPVNLPQLLSTHLFSTSLSIFLPCERKQKSKL